MSRVNPPVITEEQHAYEETSPSSSVEFNASSVSPSEFSFENIGHDVMLPSAASINSSLLDVEKYMKAERLEFHPRYATEDPMVVFQASGACYEPG
jgi:hypothetical protein